MPSALRSTISSGEMTPAYLQTITRKPKLEPRRTTYFGTCSAPIQQCRRRITKTRREVALSLTYFQQHCVIRRLDVKVLL